MNFIMIAVLVLGAIALIAALYSSVYPRNLPSKRILDWAKWVKSYLVPIVVVVALLDVPVWLQL